MTKEELRSCLLEGDMLILPYDIIFDEVTINDLRVNLLWAIIYKNELNTPQVIQQMKTFRHPYNIRNCINYLVQYGYIGRNKSYNNLDLII